MATERKLSLGEQLFERLRHRIITGELAAGSYLMPERQMALAEGVNRGAVREAIKRLAQVGLVESIHGGGNRVRDWRRTTGLELLSALLVLPNGMPDHGLLQNMLALRVTLALECLRLGVMNGKTTCLVSELSAVVEQMERRPKDMDWMQQSMLAFWEIVVQAAENMVFCMAFNSIRKVYQDYGPLLQHLQSDELRALNHYRQLVEQLRRNDLEKVEKYGRQLLELGLEQVQKVFRQQELRQQQHSDIGDLFA